MNRISNKLYRAYTSAPIRAEERDRVTLLFGGLTWRAERTVEAAFANRGYLAKGLPSATRADLIRGRELADIGQCCPTAFTTGNLINFLEDKAEQSDAKTVASDYAFVTVGSCGSCRFGQYHQSYELALRNVGFDSFRMFLLEQSGLDEAINIKTGLDLDEDLLLKAIFGIISADVIQDLEYRIRPYEVEPGATDQAVKAAVEELCQAILALSRRKGRMRAALWAFTANDFARVLRRARRHFEGIKLDRLRPRPIVKITGEFYLQTVEGEANYNIHSWLEGEGAEVYPASVAIWLDYLLRFSGQYYEDREGLQSGTYLGQKGIAVAQWLLRSHYNALRKALGGVPRPMPLQNELRDLAAPYFDARLHGGEGDMLVGKALWARKHRKAHMICELSPYACMPNTMSIGAMAAVLGDYPDLLYAPLEIKGDSEVHAISRCQMVLAEAKTRARDEYLRALAAANMTEDEARDAFAKRSDMQSPFWVVPDRGAIGMAANVVLELGGARL